MKPIYLYIENFMCHEKSVIDFSQFSSALIVGKISGNDLYSNGVGKTTLFKAIEYALFNSADVNLDKLVRDDCKSCKVIFDFQIDDSAYRVVRSRGKKGSSDLSLYKKIIEDDHSAHQENTDEIYWKDISGRRAPDTEKDLISMIKINPKSFRSTVHFAQNDFSGITTATPEKRKAMLKENLSLAFYSKMEKMTKDKYNDFSKKIDKNQALIDSIYVDPEKIKSIQDEILHMETSLFQLDKESKSLKKKLDKKSEEKNEVKSAIEAIISESKSISSQIEKENAELEKLLEKQKDFNSKKSKILAEAKSLAQELSKIKSEMEDLYKIPFSKMEEISKKIEDLDNGLNLQKVCLEKTRDKIKQLEIPLPDGTECDHCRQSLSKEHIEKCKVSIEQEIISLKDSCKLIVEKISSLKENILAEKENLKSLQSSKQKLDSITNQHSLKEEQIKDKKKYYTEYNKMIEEFQSQFSSKEELVSSLKGKIDQSSVEKREGLQLNFNLLLKEISDLENRLEESGNGIIEINNKIAVNKHSLDSAKEAIEKVKILSKENKSLEEKSKIYPNVIESFSSAGIPNLIIQNLLDELQSEANSLLNNLKPGLQLQFVTEKEKKDGTSNDTLDILYFVQGKSREYEQLSGAMKLAVNFSLKLGMSFLLQKMFDTKINLLLLDEIDQALDKAGVDAFADIIKFFQNDFTILVITHNDRLKDKFKDIILVEQNKDMASTAKVVNW